MAGRSSSAAGRRLVVEFRPLIAHARPPLVEICRQAAPRVAAPREPAGLIVPLEQECLRYTETVPNLRRNRLPGRSPSADGRSLVDFRIAHAVHLK